MQPIGENRRVPAARLRRHHDTRPYPRRAREDAEIAAWRAHAARTGWRGEIRGQRPARRGNLLRGLTGSLATGLLVLAVGLTGVQIWANGQGEPGPGATMIVGHFVAAIIALVLQRFAHRYRNLLGGIAALGVAAVVFVALWIWWWA